MKMIKMKKNASIAMIMIENQFLISQDGIKSILKKDWNLGEIENFQQKDDSIIFDIKKFNIVISSMPMPIPSQELEYPMKTAMFWENAAQDIKKHNNHFIVFVSGKEKTISIIDINIILVKIVKSIAQYSNAIGIYWGNSSQVISTKHFITHSKILDDGNLPMPIWVKVNGIRKDNNNKFYMFTQGLNAFGHKEFELLDYKNRFYDGYVLIMDLADYVLQNGPIIKNNDTMNISETEIINAKFKNLEIDNNIQVISFAF